MDHDHTWTRIETWILDLILVEMLQRSMVLSSDSLRLEMQPVFEVSSFVEFRGAKSTRTTAIVTALTVKESDLILGLRNTTDQSESALSLNDITHSRITVWRIDDVLDAIQFLFVAPEGEIYIQVGAAALSRIIQQTSFCETIRQILSNFAEAGHLPHFGDAISPPAASQ